MNYLTATLKFLNIFQAPFLGLALLFAYLSLFKRVCPRLMGVLLDIIKRLYMLDSIQFKRLFKHFKNVNPCLIQAINVKKKRHLVAHSNR